MTASPPLRYPAFLRQRYRMMAGLGGLIALVAGLVILSPLILLVAYPAEAGAVPGFALPGLLLAGAGFAAWRWLAAGEPHTLTWQEGTVILVVAWLLAILAGAVPFLAAGGLTPTQALFESTSGWTTAGLSVLDVEGASHLLLFYRSVIQLAGGAGFAIIALSALAGPVGPGLALAEGREEQLLPHVRRSAQLVLTIYAAYVVAGVVALALAGMDWFDAVNHAFAALSTGGFSTHAASLAYWDNPAVEAVTVVLMLLGTLNFVTAYTLLRGRVRAALRDSQLRLTALLLVAGTMLLLAGFAPGTALSFGERLRGAIFDATSAMSTTGFATVAYDGWSDFGRYVLLLLMLVGGGAGSTAGGIKQYRVYVLVRGLAWELRRALLPPRAVTEPDVWKGDGRRFIGDEHLRQVALFVTLYLLVYLAGAGVLVAHGHTVGASLFEFASALSTVGITAGLTTPATPPPILWTEMAAMFLGRLEFFAVAVGLARLLRDVPALSTRQEANT
ncbi:MAG: TrkH family potassium uptake protein [Anaerolineae bacterium]